METSNIKNFENSLIRVISQFDCLYSKTSTNYGNHLENDNAWVKVARTVQRPIAECIDKWYSLLQLFMHFSRLENKLGYDWVCSQWGHYKAFHKIKTNLVSNYTELFTAKAGIKKISQKEAAEQLLLIQQIDLRKDELMNPATSILRRQELWSDIAVLLNQKFPIPQRCVVDWQMVWWDIKEEFKKLLEKEAYHYSRYQIRFFNIFGAESIRDAETRVKFSKNYEFGENVAASVCLKCPSTDEEMKGGLCTKCFVSNSTRCQICLKTDSTCCSVVLLGWRIRARKLIPAHCRFNEEITICATCHDSVKERASRLWRVCRVCGEAKHPLENLMHTSFAYVRQTFEEAVGYSIRLSDGLPCYACIKCRDELMDFVRFYVTFSNTQDRMQKIQEKCLFDESISNGLSKTRPDSLSCCVADQELPQTRSSEPTRPLSKRLKLKAEREDYFSRNKALIKTEVLLKNEISQLLSGDDSDCHSEQSYQSAQIRSNSESSTITNKSEMSEENVLLPAQSTKRKRINSCMLKEIDNELIARKQEKYSRTDEDSNTASAEEGKSVESASTVSFRRKTINICNFTVEVMEESDSSPSKTRQRSSMSSDSNAEQQVEIEVLARSPNVANRPCSESEADVDNSRESPLLVVEIANLSNPDNSDIENFNELMSETLRNTSQPASVVLEIPSLKPTSDVSCEIENPAEEVSMGTTHEYQSSEQLDRNSTVLNDKSCEEVSETFSSGNKHQRAEDHAGTSLQASPTLPGEAEKVELNENENESPSKSDQAAEVSKMVAKSPRITSKASKEFPTPTPKSSARMTRTSEASATSSSESSIGMTRAISDQFLKHGGRVTRSTQQTAALNSKPNTRANKSLDNVYVSLQPTARISKSKKKLLGDMLMTCVMDKPLSSSKRVKGQIKGDIDPTEHINPAESVPDDDKIKQKPTKCILSDVTTDISSVSVNLTEVFLDDVNIEKDPTEVRLRDVAAECSPDTAPIGDVSLYSDINDSLEMNTKPIMYLPDVVESTEMRLETDIALHKTLLLDDDDDDEDVDIIGDIDLSQKQLKTDMRHIQQSSLIDCVIERSFRPGNINDVSSLNRNDLIDPLELANTKSIESE